MQTRFYLKDSSAKGGTTIILFIRMGKTLAGIRNTAKIPTGLKIAPHQWNQAKEAVRNVEAMATPMNARLQEIKSLVNLEWNRLLAEKITQEITLSKLEERIREGLKLKVKPEPVVRPKINLYEGLTQFMENAETFSARSTLSKYRSFYKLLQEFDSRLTYDKIDAKFFDAFGKFCIKKKGFTNTTFNKNIKCLKAFMNWAFDRKLTTNESYRRFKPLKEHQPNVYALTYEDFIQLLNADLQEPHLVRVRDAFCFACLTGQRWSDIENLRREHISNGFWNLTQQKTKSKVRIPLLPEAVKILDKYKDCDRPLPVISDQKTNEHLKVIGQLLEWDEVSFVEHYRGGEYESTPKKKWERLSTHLARKTFISVGLSRDIPLPMIMSISGHKDYKSIKPYIVFADKDKVEALNKAWEF